MREWLNAFVAREDEAPARPWFETSVIQEFRPAAIRIHESDRSGVVRFTNSGVSSYGDPEVFLTIGYSDGTSRYLSAPLHTPIDVLNVTSLRLSIAFETGPEGTVYVALVNAHCVYEVLGFQS